MRRKPSEIWRTYQGQKQRRCPDCNRWKPADTDHFTHAAASSDKLHTICRPCDTKRRSNSFKGIPNKISNKPDSRVLRDSIVRKVKLNRGCYVCGYRLNHRALDFHHLRSKSIPINRIRDNKTLGKEIKKCAVLCANCHRGVHWDFFSLLINLDTYWKNK